MRTLYLDMTSGISGDISLACLFQLGADIDGFSKIASDMIGRPVKLSLEKTERNSIECSRLKIDTEIKDEPFKHMRDLRKMIVATSLPEIVKSNALKSLEILAEAESKVHGIPVDDVHFHEVGAVDTIIDCVGFAWALNDLKIEKVSSSHPLFGYGTVKTQHGILPLPAPATLKILEGVPVKRIDVEGELTTPTGAAILKTYVSEFTRSFHGEVGKDCYATGSMEFEGVSNLTRAILFHDDRIENKDEVLLMKTNIDDMSGENFGFLLDTLMNTGALDVSYSPAYGKKNRPSYGITVMLPKDKEKEIAKIIFRYSTTAGIRVQIVDRLIMGREMIHVQVDGEPINVKRLFYDDIEKFCPEWDDCVSASKRAITTPTDIHCRATLLAAKAKNER